MNPKTVTDLDMAFGGRAVSELLPAWDAIPDRYRRHPGMPMNRLVSRWFFEGIQGAKFVLRPGIDRTLALRHLATCIGSFEPSHEHKEAGCAYLCALWFDRVEVGGETYASDIAPQEVAP